MINTHRQIRLKAFYATFAVLVNCCNNCS